MTRLLRSAWALLSSRVTSPAVLGIFLLVYIVIAFGTDETLITLMAVTSASTALLMLLALLPLSSAARCYRETARYLARRRVLRGEPTQVPEGLFEETVRLPAGGSLDEVKGRLEAEGYTTSLAGESLGAWRGASGSWSRIVFLAGTFCLFAGILISLSTRTSHRQSVLEGEPMPTAAGGGGVVEKISLVPGTGRILSRDLTLQVARSEAGDPAKTCGLYPPALYRGNFVYPRYLGIAPQLKFSAPDFAAGKEAYYVLNIYPAGKDDKVEFAGSPYRLDVGMAEPGDGSDPFVSGKITLLFKLVKGKDLVLNGSVPLGGTFERDGYRLSFPSYRRHVITDFVQDYGVLFIWTSMALFAAAFLIWLPVRLCFPRGELAIVRDGDGMRAYARAEGGRTRHNGVFHEMLDLLESRAHDRSQGGAGQSEMAGN